MRAELLDLPLIGADDLVNASTLVGTAMAPKWYVEHCESRLKEFQTQLAPLEAGNRIYTRKAGDPDHTDITDDMIHRIKGWITDQERIIKRLKAEQ